MDTKQIATLLKVEPKSVRMTKYRLKQKLNLEKEEELDEYLRRL
jgi:DNA-binding CsgD family transcriptional regulator